MNVANREKKGWKKNENFPNGNEKKEGEEPKTVALKLKSDRVTVSGTFNDNITNISLPLDDTQQLYDLHAFSSGVRQVSNSTVR